MEQLKHKKLIYFFVIANIKRYRPTTGYNYIKKCANVLLKSPTNLAASYFAKLLDRH